MFRDPGSPRRTLSEVGWGSWWSTGRKLPRTEKWTEGVDLVQPEIRTTTTVCRPYTDEMSVYTSWTTQGPCTIYVGVQGEKQNKRKEKLEPETPGSPSPTPCIEHRRVKDFGSPRREVSASDWWSVLGILWDRGSGTGTEPVSR